MKEGDEEGGRAGGEARSEGGEGGWDLGWVVLVLGWGKTGAGKKCEGDKGWV